MSVRKDTLIDPSLESEVTRLFAHIFCSVNCPCSILAHGILLVRELKNTLSRASHGNFIQCVTTFDGMLLHLSRNNSR